MQFNLIIAVWGSSYVSSLCELTLPSLAFGSASSPDPQTKWKFIIHTRPSERGQIRACVEHLFPFAEIAFFDLRPEEFADHYRAMAHAHYAAAVLSVREGARGIILTADAVFSAGALALIESAARSGKRALMVAGPRLSEQTATQPLKSLLAKNSQVPARELVALAQRHLHPEMRRYFWDSDDFSTSPFMCCWKATDGWLSRNFHLHPLMIDFSAAPATAILATDTIDGEFVGESIGVWDDIHVVQDSDELFLVTLTPDDATYSEKSDEPASVTALRRTAYEHPIVNPLHRWLFTKAIKTHTSDLDASWKTLEEETGLLAFRILCNRDKSPSEDNVAIADEVEMSPPAPEPRHTAIGVFALFNRRLARLATRIRR